LLKNLISSKGRKRAKSGGRKEKDRRGHAEEKGEDISRTTLQEKDLGVHALAVKMRNSERLAVIAGDRQDESEI